MATIQLPNSWRPRPYQRKLWRYLERGGTRALEIAHRRWGKDEVCLHWAAVAAHLKPATYWHMLPLATQARKAIWEAINPHTGRRRIDEAFPVELRETTLNNEMMIRFKCGSTWQVVGSDNFNALVGAPPAGVVFSEFALNNPAAWAYIQPILEENGGWALFITTPRGRNHAHRMLGAAQKDPDWFTDVQSAHDTGIFDAQRLAKIRGELIAIYGEDAGDAMFRQEYLCDFDAAVLGAYYGREVEQAKREGRVTRVQHDPAFQVFTAWDLGYSDDTSIWFWQVIAGEIRVLECYSDRGKTLSEYAAVIKSRPYDYGGHWLPHDARAKTLASGGRSIMEMLGDMLGGPGKIAIVPSLALQDGIQAVRAMFPRCWFDADGCALGLDALPQYRREYDTEKRMFRDAPMHDWTSHLADAFRMMAIAWREARPAQTPEKPRFLHEMSLDELWSTGTATRGSGRI